MLVVSGEGGSDEESLGEVSSGSGMFTLLSVFMFLICVSGNRSFTIFIVSGESGGDGELYGSEVLLWLPVWLLVWLAMGW